MEAGGAPLPLPPSLCQCSILRLYLTIRPVALA